MLSNGQDGLFTFPGVTRVELIDDTGRAYTTYNAHEVMVSVQDNGRTLKVFLKTQEPK